MDSDDHGMVAKRVLPIFSSPRPILCSLRASSNGLATTCDFPMNLMMPLMYLMSCVGTRQSDISDVIEQQANLFKLGQLADLLDRQVKLVT